MVRYNIDDVTEDMVLGESVVTQQGKILLNAGYKITTRYKERLKELGYRTVLIEVAGTEEVKPETLVSTQNQIALTNSMDQGAEKVAGTLSRLRGEGRKDVHKLIFEHRRDFNECIMNPSISRQLETVMEEIMSEPGVVLNLAALKKAEDSFYAHSVNVTITSLCIGKKHNLAYEEMKQLGVGALNYHVGLLALPAELVHKADALTDEEKESYREHTVLGHLMLVQNLQISPNSAACALQHHELQNGKGYPLGLTGSNRPPVKDITRTKEIHRFAEIVTVADTYHTLIMDHAQGDPQVIGGAIKKLIAMSGLLLNRHIVKTLVSVVPVYPVGARVRITEADDSGVQWHYAVVGKDNSQELSRPTLVVFAGPTGLQLPTPFMLDTAAHRDVKFELA